jgi:hypothetical protein
MFTLLFSVRGWIGKKKHTSSTIYTVIKPVLLSQILQFLSAVDHIKSDEYNIAFTEMVTQGSGRLN